MNRDEGIYNISHVYDPVMQEKNNTKKTLWPEVVKKFPVTHQLDHYINNNNNNNSLDEADWSSLRNSRQKREFCHLFNLFIDIYQTLWIYKSMIKDVFPRGVLIYRHRKFLVLQVTFDFELK